MKKIKKSLPLTAGLLPMLAFAATIGDIISTVEDIINLIIPVLVALGVMWFIWGIIQYMTSGDNVEKREEARDTMIYGIIGLFVIVAMWGLVNVISDTFDIDATGGGAPTINLTP